MMKTALQGALVGGGVLAIASSTALAFTYEPLTYQVCSNDHTYVRVVVRSISPGETFSFATAKEYAHSLRVGGMPGHLATITSDEEQQLLKDHPQTIGGGGMSAALAAPNGSFYWQDGPEARDFAAVPTNVIRLACCCPDHVSRYMQVDRDRWYSHSSVRTWVGPDEDHWSTPECGGPGLLVLLIEFSTSWTVPAPRIDYPIAGTRIGQGDSIAVGWATEGGCGPIVCAELSVSRTGTGGPFELIADSLPPSGEHVWVASGPASDSVFFKISVCDSTGFTGEAISMVPIGVVGIETVSTDGRLALADPFPQPSRGRTTLQYDLPRTGPVTVSIVDVQGRVLRTLVSERRSAGSHTTRFDSRGLRASVVFARLEFEGRSLTKRIVLTP